MTVSPFDSQLFSKLLSDTEVTPFFSDQAYLRALIEFEIALAKVEAEVGVIPGEAYPQIERLAGEFGLSLPLNTWHTQRDNVSEFAGWLSQVTGSLGKIGQDLVLLAQSEEGEVHFASGGGSSTLPQKSNPIGAEILVTMVRLNSGLLTRYSSYKIQTDLRFLQACAFMMAVNTRNLKTR
jgi:adenylosuccinate lyase